MKKIFMAALLLALLGNTALRAQERVIGIMIMKNGDTLQEYYLDEIDSIVLADVIPYPSNVSVDVAGDIAVIGWTAVSGATYDIYRSSDDVSYTLLTSGVTGGLYVDNLPMPGNNYYKVACRQDGDVSKQSPAVKAVVDFIPYPSNVSADVVGDSVIVTWTAESGATYDIYRSSDDASYTLLASGVTGELYVDNSPVPGCNYYKIVRHQYGEVSEQIPAVKALFDNGIYTVNGVSFEMIAVDGGTFQMGSVTGYDNEMPVHKVTLSDFAIGQTEVTQALWKAVMGSNPSSWQGDNLPVEKVSWDDCQTFITKLNTLLASKYDGKVVFRLPTEAEWEFAAKGGNNYRGYYYSGSDEIGDIAWYRGNSDGETHPVAMKSPNELGIYDMSGNVREWCQDWYGSYSSISQTNPTGPSSGSDRVYRGGGWDNAATSCRAAYRGFYTPTGTDGNLGLRLAK